MLTNHKPYGYDMRKEKLGGFYLCDSDLPMAESVFVSCSLVLANELKLITVSTKRRTRLWLVWNPKVSEVVFSASGSRQMASSPSSEQFPHTRIKGSV